MKGFYVLLMHMIPVLVLWVLPLALLAQFGGLPEKAAFLLVVPVVVASLVSLMRTAHRHSVPRR